MNTLSLRNQKGVSLLIVLLLLLIMTLLGIAGLRSTIMEEKMSSNLLDRSIAFQSVEAALREAEVTAAGAPVFPSTGCSNGLCAAPSGTSQWASLPTGLVAIANFPSSQTVFRHVIALRPTALLLVEPE